MTWRDLGSPTYLLTFLEAFLIGALPVLGLSSAITNGSLQPHAWPSGPAMLAALLVGGVNGIRAIKTLLTPPPPPKLPCLIATLLGATMLLGVMTAEAGPATLGWDMSTGATNYGIEKSTDNGTTWAAVAPTSGPACSVTVNRCVAIVEAPSAGLVLYRIWAENSVGRAIRFSAGLWVCESCSPPAQPTNIEVK